MFCYFVWLLCLLPSVPVYGLGLLKVFRISFLSWCMFIGFLWSWRLPFLFQIYGFSWIVLAVIVVIFKVCFLFVPYDVALFKSYCEFTKKIHVLQIFSLSPKKYAGFQLWMRFFQGVIALGLVTAITLVIVFTKLAIADVFASVLAFIATGWGILCVSFMALESCLLSIYLLCCFIVLRSGRGGSHGCELLSIPLLEQWLSCSLFIHEKSLFHI